jgi:hypothetical protein
MRRKLVAVMVVSSLAGLWMACGDSGSSVFENGTDEDGGVTPGPGSGPFPSGNDAGPPPKPDGSLGTCDAGCAQGARCKYGVCVPDLGTCSTNDNCPGDSYCDTDMTCVPYGVPPEKINDPTCARPMNPGTVQPAVQCEWAAPPDAGDPTAAYVSVYTAPIVADLNLDLDPNKLQPSVIVTTWGEVSGERIGMLRVFDGRTCEEQMRIGGPDDLEVEENRPAYGTQLAVGDLDNDVGTPNGHPEIVALHRTTAALGTYPPLSLVAFKIDTSGGAPRLVRKWTGRICGTDGGPDEVVTFGNNLNNYGPGIWDIDDDGNPEVVLDMNVFDQNGCLLNPPAQFAPYLDHGSLSTVADVDLDNQPDLVRADGVYGWNKVTKQWDLKPWFVRDDAGTQKLGHLAVADLGRYSTIPGKTTADPLPEVIIVSAETTTRNPSSSGTVRVQTLTGETVFGPVPLFKFTQPHGGHGGPPTASDFDGDGYPEFAAAANEFYTVYDPDCDGVDVDGGVSPLTATVRPGGKCMRPSYMAAYAGGPVPLSGILWAQPSQDFTSSETGSSIFDFNGDGKSEAVYRDECYLRVYEGSTGNVLFSSPASSGTGQELPVICDVDGDFATEIVVARATNPPLTPCPTTDPLAPDAGDAGAPPFVKAGGFVILRDPLDRWVPSRPIWNQHAYSITNVTDDGRIPKASTLLRNWEQPGMNNFRQNTQGSLGKLALADLTAQIENLSGLCSGESGTFPLTTRVCNRGTNPVQDGVTIAFYSAAGDAGTFDAAGASLICESTTQTLLNPGQCTTVTCTGFVAGDRDVFVVTDPAGTVADCHPGNNNGASARVLCPVVK